MDAYMRQAGREDDVAPGAAAASLDARAAAIRAALGGVGNIVRIEPCALTRLRVELREGRGVRQSDLVAAGALGLLRVSEHLVHVIVGEDAPPLAREIAARAAP